MPIEHEAKFLGVDADDVRARLKAAGATCRIPERLMRRVIIDYPDQRLRHARKGYDQWIRVRDEGHKVTLTYKNVVENAAGGAQELEVVVSDYETTIKIFESIGLKVFCSQETKRETWDYGDVEVVIDTWPFIPTFVEVEGSGQESIKAAAERLGFDWVDACFGTANVIYRKYYPKMTEDEVIGAIPELRFNMELPQWLKDRQ